MKDKFSNYNLADKYIEIITTAAKDGNKDIDRAYEYLIKYNKPIKNIIPFIVKATDFCPITDGIACP